MRNKSLVILICLIMLIFIGNLSFYNPMKTPSGIPQSADDMYEENDSYSTAYNISTDYTYMNLYAASLDMDWFKLYLTVNTIFDCSISWSNDSGDIYFAFKDKNISLLTEIHGHNCKGNFSYAISQSGFYYISIEQIGPYVGATYNMTLRSRSDDIYEINDQFSSAKVMSNYKNYKNLVIYPNNEDWYKILFETYTQISVNIDYVLGSDLNLYLYSSEHTLLNQSINNFVDKQTVNYTIISGGFYFGQVTLSSGSMTYYDLFINGEDDLYEPNNNMIKAKSLTNGIKYNLILLPNESDWFKVEVYSASNLMIKLESDKNSDLECALYEENNLTITPTVTENANYVEFTYAINTAGNYYVEINSSNLVPIHYTLSVSDGSNFFSSEFPMEYFFYIILVLAVVGIVLLIRNRYLKSTTRKDIKTSTDEGYSTLNNVNYKSLHSIKTLWGFTAEPIMEKSNSKKIPKPGTIFFDNGNKNEGNLTNPFQSTDKNIIK